ncbi:hypothetical protein CQA16_13715 [Enterobacter hormaechei]|nr:hypothetical protein SR84_04955 [Enterobacter hormaechei subsp. xiangfangensis]PCO09324.1 hypothetical protein CQA16_13715 [Enterobacter hormaechei]
MHIQYLDILKTQLRSKPWLGPFFELFIPQEIETLTDYRMLGIQIRSAMKIISSWMVPLNSQ